MSQQTTSLREHLQFRTNEAINNSQLYFKVVSVLKNSADNGDSYTKLSSESMNSINGGPVASTERGILLRRLLEEGVEAEFICEDRPCGKSYYEFRWAD